MSTADWICRRHLGAANEGASALRAEARKVRTTLAAIDMSASARDWMGEESWEPCPEQPLVATARDLLVGHGHRVTPSLVVGRYRLPYCGRLDRGILTTGPIWH